MRLARVALCGLLLASTLAAQHHYIFFNRDRERIRDADFLRISAIEGAQIKYLWSRLEPNLGEYRFGAVREDLEFLTARGKRLFIQLQDVSFDPNVVNVPAYLLADPRYHGGAARQYDGDRPAGWVARRWDPAVAARFHRLLEHLGREFDGRIEGITLPETAIDFTDGKYRPDGFTDAGYRDGVIDTMRALKRAFPKSAAMQYANFMPGEWLPANDRGYLRAVYRAARELGVGVGGPDLLPDRRGQLDHAYPLIREASGAVPTGIAVQEGNYTRPVADLLAFARDRLRVRYIFWCTEEPFYSSQVLPMLERLRPGVIR